MSRKPSWTPAAGVAGSGAGTTADRIDIRTDGHPAALTDRRHRSVDRQQPLAPFRLDPDQHDRFGMMSKDKHQRRRMMIGITLNSEQIRQAPPDVRQWIEREVIASLGLQIRPAADKPHGEHLASCNAEELAAILAQIQGVLPAVN